MRRACGKDFEPTSTKSRKKRKRLYPVDSIFLKFISAFFKIAIHTKDTKVIPAQQHSHTVIWCMKSENQQIGFSLVWRRRGGESAVMKQADRLYHMTSPVGTHPPNKPLHRNTPTISRYSAKLKEEKMIVWPGLIHRLQRQQLGSNQDPQCVRPCRRLD